MHTDGCTLLPTLCMLCSSVLYWVSYSLLNFITLYTFTNKKCVIVVFVIQLSLSLISVIGEKTLFCRSRDLLETFENGTPFCAITGMFKWYSMQSIFYTSWYAEHILPHYIQELYTTTVSFKSQCGYYSIPELCSGVLYSHSTTDDGN